MVFRRAARLGTMVATTMLALSLAACAPAVKDDASQVNACTACVDNTLASVTKVTLRATSTTSVTLTWTDPTDAGLTGVEVRRSATAYPAGPSDGIEVYNGAGSTASESGLSTTSADYYAVFSSYNSGDYGPGADALRPLPLSTGAAGQVNGYGIGLDGRLWSWGENSSGTLGLGSDSGPDTCGTNSPCATTPQQIGTDTNWSAVYSHDGIGAFALKKDGTLWAWGRNDQGQLGIGTTSGPDTCVFGACAMVPTQVGTDTNWSTVSTGSTHSGSSTETFYTLALKNNGTLWAWGANSDGQLGIGSTAQESSPTQVGTATSWSAVSAGASSTHPVSVGIKTDGTLWAWGYGLSTSPAQVGSTTGWKVVSSSGASGSGNNVVTTVFLIKTDGTLWSWGGSTSTDPTQIGTATNWAHVSALAYNIVAVRTDGTLWTWKDNVFGEAGNGTSGSGSATPAQAGSGSNWSNAWAGADFDMAITSRGTLWGWGVNWASQTGTPAADSPAQCGSNATDCVLSPTRVPIQ